MKKERNWWAIIWGAVLIIGIIGAPASFILLGDRGGTWPEDYIVEIYLFLFIFAGSFLMMLVGGIGLFLNLRAREKRKDVKSFEMCDSTSEDKGGGL